MSQATGHSVEERSSGESDDLSPSESLVGVDSQQEICRCLVLTYTVLTRECIVNPSLRGLRLRSY